jgi:hypothetical protein
MASSGVQVWWAAMCVFAVVNVVIWARSARAAIDDGAPAEVARYRRRQLLLSCGFVLGCAFRSFTLRADVQRFCMIDSWVGCVFVGRSVATIAELSLVAQLALLLHALATRARAGFPLALSFVLVPIIAVAETCSWYAVLTTNYIGNACEESLWTIMAFLFTLGLATLFPKADRSTRRLIALGLVAGLVYVAFMSAVDVPMYLTRWRADAAAGRAYFSLGDGVRDSMRWVVTLRWEDWQDEIPWMSLYFWVVPLLSIRLVQSLPRESVPAIAR